VEFWLASWGTAEEQVAPNQWIYITRQRP
jgi:hypothetical protein